jgi:hypothetical protein
MCACIYRDQSPTRGTVHEYSHMLCPSWMDSQLMLHRLVLALMTETYFQLPLRVKRQLPTALRLVRAKSGTGTEGFDRPGHRSPDSAMHHLRLSSAGYLLQRNVMN